MYSVSAMQIKYTANDLNVVACALSHIINDCNITDGDREPCVKLALDSARKADRVNIVERNGRMTLTFYKKDKRTDSIAFDTL